MNDHGDEAEEEGGIFRECGSWIDAPPNDAEDEEEEDEDSEGFVE